MNYHSDAFGRHEIESEEDIEAAQSIEKVCVVCDRLVMLPREYDVCDSCASKREKGWDI